MIQILPISTIIKFNKLELTPSEIIREQPYAPSIDVWTIGVLLYELLYVCSPFGNSENINEIFQNIIINKFFVDDKLNLSNDCINLINLIKKLFEFDDEQRNKNFNSSLDFEQFKKYESNSNVAVVEKSITGYGNLKPTYAVLSVPFGSFTE